MNAISYKREVINKFALNEHDTGSVEVQCALLTERVKSLTLHLKENPKDFSSRKGLLMLVSQRRSLLNYLKKVNVERYNNLIKRLSIRK